METSYNCAKWCSATTYQKVNSSIVSKGAMNNFNEMFPLARMFPLAVMHRGYSKKGGVSLIFTLTLSSVIFLSVCGVYVFYWFTRFLSVFFVFHWNDLVLLNLISRFITSAKKVIFWKAKVLLTSVKYVFDTSEWLM